MKKLLLSILLSLITRMGWAQSERELRGQVSDSKTQEPIFNVNVHLFNTNLQTTTTADGYFTISNPALGQQVVVISFTRYSTRALPVLIEEGSLDLVTIYLEEDVTTEMQMSRITLTENEFGDVNTGSVTTSDLLQASCDQFQQIA